MIAKSKIYFFKYKEKITFIRQIVVEDMASWYHVILMNMENLKSYLFLLILLKIALMCLHFAPEHFHFFILF